MPSEIETVDINFEIVAREEGLRRNGKSVELTLERTKGDKEILLLNSRHLPHRRVTYITRRHERVKEWKRERVKEKRLQDILKGSSIGWVRVRSESEKLDSHPRSLLGDLVRLVKQKTSLSLTKSVCSWRTRCPRAANPFPQET